MIRDDMNDLVYLTIEEKYDAIVEDINDCMDRGQPVLVGTASIESSERLSNELDRRKIAHNVPSQMTPDRYPIVTLETEPGDATVHYGCGLHAGPPPTGDAPRRTLYLQHYGPGASARVFSRRRHRRR